MLVVEEGYVIVSISVVDDVVVVVVDVEGLLVVVVDEARGT